MSTTKDYVNKEYNYLIKLSTTQYIIMAVVLIRIFSLPFTMLFEITGSSFYLADIQKIMQPGKLWIYLITLLIAAPLLGTVICQVLPYHLLKSIRIINNADSRRVKLFFILLSATIFSILNLTQNIWYAVAMFPMGLVLAFTFVLYLNKKKSAFWVTAGVHAASNSLAFAGIFVMQYFNL